MFSHGADSAHDAGAVSTGASGVPTRFVWPYGGKRVYLTGSFTRFASLLLLLLLFLPYLLINGVYPIPYLSYYYHSLPSTCATLVYLPPYPSDQTADLGILQNLFNCTSSSAPCSLRPIACRALVSFHFIQLYCIDTIPALYLLCHCVVCAYTS